MSSHRLVVAVLVVSLLVVPLGVAASSDEYSISTNASKDLPDRNVDIDEGEFTITHVSRVEKGDGLKITASGPSDNSSDVIFRDADNENLCSEDRFSGSVTITCSMDYVPGSYAITLKESFSGGELEKIHPVVIKAYDVSHDRSDSNVEKGNSFDVTVEVDELDDYDPEKDINKVEVIVAEDENIEIQKEADEISGGDGDYNYEATISTDSLDTGDYSLYGTVRGTDEVRGSKELLGFSDPTTVTVESTDTPTPTPEDDGGGGGGGGGGGALGPIEEEEDGEEEEEDGEEGEGETEIEEEPDTEVEQTIESDEEDGEQDSESSGSSVEFDETESVQKVTFDDSDVSGSVQVQEYTDPPESVTADITEQLTGETGSDDGTDSQSESESADSGEDGSTSETDGGGDATDGSADDGSDGTDGTDGDTSSDSESDSGSNVATVVDISPTSDTASQSTATVEIEVSRSKLDDPSNAFVVHESSSGTWEQLGTTVEERSDGVVTLQAQVDSFSLFAVVDGDMAEETSTSSATPMPTATPSNTPTTAGTATPTATPTPDSIVTPESTPAPTATPTPGASGPGFTVGLALLAFLVSGYALKRD